MSDETCKFRRQDGTPCGRPVYRRGRCGPHAGRPSADERPAFDEPMPPRPETDWSRLVRLIDELNEEIGREPTLPVIGLRLVGGFRARGGPRGGA